MTRKKLYSVIDSLNDNKAAGAGEISIRLIKSCKLAIGVHLQLVLNECFKEKIFSTKMKLLLERLLLTQMMEFNDKHKIINKEQFRFQKKSLQQMQF